MIERRDRVWRWIERAAFIAAIVAAVIAALDYIETSESPPRVASAVNQAVSPAMIKLSIILLGLFAVSVCLLRLARLEGRVNRLDHGFHGVTEFVRPLAGARRRQEKYTLIQRDGTPREWTRNELDNLQEVERGKLFEVHPDLVRWWLAG